MKKISTPKLTVDQEMAPEYRFDYSKAKPNRFAASKISSPKGKKPAAKTVSPKAKTTRKPAVKAKKAPAKKGKKK